MWSIDNVFDEVRDALADESWPWLIDGDREAVMYFLASLFIALPISVESTLRLDSGATIIVSAQRVSYIVGSRSSYFKRDEPFEDGSPSPYEFALVVLEYITLAYLRIPV